MAKARDKAKSATSQRKAPKQKRSLGLVDALLEAATRVLSKRELDEVSTNQIAELAGASVGSLYQYFPNKESLASAVMEKIMAIQVNFMAKIEADIASDDLDEAIKKYLDYFFAHFIKYRSLFRILGKHIFRINQFENLIQLRFQIRDAISLTLQRRSNLSAVEADRMGWVIVVSVAGALESIAFTKIEGEDLVALQTDMEQMISAYIKSKI